MQMVLACQQDASHRPCQACLKGLASAVRCGQELWDWSLSGPSATESGLLGLRLQPLQGMELWQKLLSQGLCVAQRCLGTSSRVEATLALPAQGTHCLHAVCAQPAGTPVLWPVGLVRECPALGTLPRHLDGPLPTAGFGECLCRPVAIPPLSSSLLYTDTWRRLRTWDSSTTRLSGAYQAQPGSRPGSVKFQQ